MRQRREGDFSLRIVEELVRRGDTVLDVGARWGTYAWLLERVVGPEGHVHVFEPNPAHGETLRRIGANGRRMTVHTVGLSDASGEAVLHIPLVGGEVMDGLASVSPPPGGPDEVRAVAIRLEPLDSIAVGPISFVKCDVEGHELAVFRGGERTLRKWRPSILVEIEQRHHGANVEATFSQLAELGYVGYSVTAEGLRPVEDFDVERDQLAFLPRSGEHVVGWAMPSGYVHDFLFVDPQADVERLVAPS
jgi:FkbM family methyltransferase